MGSEFEVSIDGRKTVAERQDVWDTVMMIRKAEG
jgi:hypothetical protein